MRGMKPSRKIWLIIIALALLAGLAWLVWRGSRPDEPFGGERLGHLPRPVVRGARRRAPRRPAPRWDPPGLVRAKARAYPPRAFDYTSPGAQIGSIEHNRIELSADGWELFIETHVEGRVAPGTHLVFSTGLGGRQVRLNCRPADRATGSLRTTTRAGSDELDGRFLVELATCKNAESGKTINWPPAPLTVRGSFVGLPHGRR